MIRIAIKSSNYDKIKSLIKNIFASYEYIIDNINEKKMYDIFVVEINQIDDLKIIDTLKKHNESLVYVIGPRNFDIANECIRRNVHLYFLNNEIESEIQKYKEDIYKQVQQRFQYYVYKRNGINSQIRLSQIYYIETLRHSIIIHSVNGEFVERKNLNEFLNEVSSLSFIQIHKSFAVNKQHIEKTTSQEVIVKNGARLPIGRVYKDALKI